MFDAHTRRMRRARKDALGRCERAARQLPCHSVRRHRDVADLDASRPAARIHTAEPQMMLAASIYLSLEARYQVFGRPTHAC
jgi:hypothetical protein